MNTTRFFVTAAAMMFAAGVVMAELPGLPEASIRPTEKPASNIIVTPSTPVRGSLYRQAARTPVPVGTDGQPIGPSFVDFTAVRPVTPRKFQKNDLVTIIVAERSTTSSSEQNASKKKQDYDVALQQFVQLGLSASGLPTVGVVGQPSKLPEIKFTHDHKRDASASTGSSDTFTDRFSAVVVDVKPNGTMVIEAVRRIAVNNNVQEYRMSGICRIQDVTADNTVLSTQLANLDLSKQTKGEVRDAVKSGWLNRMMDKYSIF